MSLFSMLRFFLLVVSLTCSEALIAQQVLSDGHAHNDYEQKRPLHDAIQYGFMSIEIDIWAVNDEFLVSHTRLGLKRSPALRELYLEPLGIHLDSMSGSVYGQQVDEFVLMLDLKGSWTTSELSDLEAYFGDLSQYLSVFRKGEHQRRAIRLLLSGDGGKYGAVTLEPRVFSIDGGLDDVGGPRNPDELPRVSARYGSLFTWKGRGQQPEQERLKMMELVRAAHADGRKIRFWAVPNKEAVWQALSDADVDWINVDRLERFHSFSAHQASED